MVGGYALVLWVREVHLESDPPMIPAYHTLFYIVEHLCSVETECILGETKPQAELQEQLQAISASATNRYPVNGTT